MAKKKKELDSDYPIVLVFYINRAMYAAPEIIRPYVEGIKSMFDDKGDNIIAFFLPTDDSERIECINPRFLDNEAEYKKITDFMEELQAKFDIGQGADDNLEDLPEDVD